MCRQPKPFDLVPFPPSPSSTALHHPQDLSSPPQSHILLLFAQNRLQETVKHLIPLLDIGLRTQTDNLLVTLLQLATLALQLPGPLFQTVVVLLIGFDPSAQLLRTFKVERRKEGQLLLRKHFPR